MWKRIVADNAVFLLSIASFVPEIFTIKVYSCLKFNALLITQELLHSAWWNFARISTWTTSKSLLNFKVVGQRSRSHSFAVFFLCAWYCSYPRTVLCLELGSTMLFFNNFITQQVEVSCGQIEWVEFVSGYKQCFLSSSDISGIINVFEVETFHEDKYGGRMMSIVGDSRWQ